MLHGFSDFSSRTLFISLTLSDRPVSTRVELFSPQRNFNTICILDRGISRTMQRECGEMIPAWNYDIWINDVKI